MFLSITTLVSGTGEAVGSVAMAPSLVTVIMAVIAVTLAFGAVVIMGEWLQGWLTARRNREHKASNRRSVDNRPHWRVLTGHRSSS